jgi:murein DD-endopeptidase MepM/ murein hydrolase activator NlpD
LHSQAINRSLISKAPIESALRGFCPPLKGQSLISQGNGGITHSGRAKYAYDYAVGMGTPVFSMRRAKVLQIQDGYPDTGGSRHKATKSNFVLLEHPGGYRSAYVHLQQSFSNKVNVKSGMWVATGQLIGYSGNSGWSSGPHLHVEVQEPSNNLGFSHTIPFQISNNCPGRKA